MDKTNIIKKAINALLKNKRQDAAQIIKSEYQFTLLESCHRSCTIEQKAKTFLRDGFIDRYTCDRLVNPGILKVLSSYYPEEFPYHPHWKMAKTHIAYWELFPTIDHILPIACGGKDEESNWATTSMLHNQVKSNWSLEQLNWKIHECGNINEWDGLTSLFIQLVEKDQSLLKENYIKNWFRASKKHFPGNK